MLAQIMTNRVFLFVCGGCLSFVFFSQGCSPPFPVLWGGFASCDVYFSTVMLLLLLGWEIRKNHKDFFLTFFCHFVFSTRVWITDWFFFFIFLFVRFFGFSTASIHHQNIELRSPFLPGVTAFSCRFPPWGLGAS